MKKILFLIHDLGQGGAEKVLVNLVNNMDPQKFDISVTALFGGGVNEQFLKPHIHYRAIFKRPFPGNTHIMKLFSPKMLHRWFIRDHYDIEISYLEGASARIISGCPNKDTKLVSWIHSTFLSEEDAVSCFRGFPEARMSNQRFHRTVCVSAGIKAGFINFFPSAQNVCVLYNTVESQHIIDQAKKPVSPAFNPDEISLIGVGSLKPVKGFDRLIRVHSQLCDSGYPVHTYLLGKGPDHDSLKQLALTMGHSESVTFLGFDTNPYKYVANSDVFVCSSHSEGFSTAATEALIVGTPVCTVEVSGMKEMLGDNNEWGIVTENSEEALYQGIKCLLDDPELLTHYKKQAALRGKTFSTEKTVKAVEDMLLSL
jgi:glycosyltransferase involved in cell wall biosynthesis